LSIVSTIKFVDTILQDLAANLKMTLLDAYCDHALLAFDSAAATGAGCGIVSG
jgi:hypothetical protein